VAMTRNRNRSRYLVAILLLAALTLITLDARGDDGGVLSSTRRDVQSVLSPVQSGIHDALRPIGDFLTGAADYGSLKAENNRLRDELTQEAGTSAAATYAESQAEQVLALANLPFAAGIKTVRAAVIEQPFSNFENSIIINRGTSSGVAVGQPVVAAAGLAGKVSAVTSTTATVTLITDPTFVCGVALPAANVGSATGQGQGENLSVSVIPSRGRSPTLQKGEKLWTSDLGGDFPGGIPVGSLRTVTVPGGGSPTTATVAPSVDAATLAYVAVMLWSGQ
jgi:rod shape-determining protein MreC